MPLSKKWLILSNWLGLYAGPSGTIGQFWLFAGQCKSIADQRKLLYIFGKNSGYLRGYTRVTVKVRVLRLGLLLGSASLGYCPASNSSEHT